jgi:hypothetical protein
MAINKYFFLDTGLLMPVRMAGFGETVSSIAAPQPGTNVGPTA